MRSSPLSALCLLPLLITLASGCDDSSESPDCPIEGERQGELVCTNGRWERHPIADTMMDMSADDASTSSDQGDLPDDSLPPVDMTAPSCTVPAVLNAHADERVMQGSSYRVMPELTAGAVSRWRKAYGPDDVTVDATTGELRWEVPATLPGESFYVGVRGVDACGGRVEDVWVLTVGDGEVWRVGAGQEHTLYTAARAAKAGDTIIVEPGEYANDQTGSLNSDVYSGPWLRSGEADGYTTLIAAEPGESVFHSRLYLDTKYGDTHHLAIKGLQIKDDVQLAASDDNPHSHHIKLVDLGVEGAIYISEVDDALVEGCYVYGGSRYKISAYKSARVIFRRTVTRQDHGPVRGDTNPFGVAIAYSSEDVIFQNVIDLDSDQRDLYPTQGEMTGTFAVPVTAGPSARILYTRSMSLRNRTKWGSNDSRDNGGDTGRFYADVTYDNVIGWDIDTVPGSPDLMHSFGNSRVQQGTFGDVHTTGDHAATQTNAYFNGWCGEDAVNDTFFSSVMGPMFYEIEHLSHNALHDVSDTKLIHDNGQHCGGYTPPPRDQHLETFLSVSERDAVLKYLPRIEPGSVLQGAGRDGGDIGALVMTFVGRSGTLFGEPGWDEETGESMWPFPHEERIAAHMRAYRYDGPLADGKMVAASGDRGFASEATALDGGPQTLTSYIWEYLGYPCPTEICRP